MENNKKNLEIMSNVLQLLKEGKAEQLETAIQIVMACDGFAELTVILENVMSDQGKSSETGGNSEECPCESCIGALLGCPQNIAESSEEEACDEESAGRPVRSQGHLWCKKKPSLHRRSSHTSSQHLRPQRRPKCQWYYVKKKYKLNVNFCIIP